MSDNENNGAINDTAPIIESNVPAQAAGMIEENGVPTIVSAGADKMEMRGGQGGVPGVNVMSGQEQLHTISLLVENRPGILARVSQVFARRGFNLESLAVSRTEDPTVSRMTIVVAGDDEAFTQMGKQMLKLIDVIKVIDHTRDNLVGRELALIKVRAGSEQRAQIMQIAQAFRVKLADITPDTLMIEVTGNADKVDAVQRMLEPFEILELVRTGLIVLTRGPKQT